MKIAMLKGFPEARLGDRMVLYNNNLGIGFEIITNDTQFEELLDGQVVVHVWHVITDRDQHLYGFKTREQVNLAKLISRAAGVGPALSCKLVQSTDLGELEFTLHTGDARRLAGLCSGLGLKKARAILALDLPKHSVPQAAFEAVKALEALGHTMSTERKQAICRAASSNPEMSSAELVRVALDQEGGT